MQAKVRVDSPGGRSETKGVGFVNEVGFKLGVKERWSYRCKSGESEEEEVMGEGKELVPELGLRRDIGS